MESIFLTPDFDRCKNYRLFKIDAAWLKNLKVDGNIVSSVCARTRSKRQRSPEPDAGEPRMFLWAKGGHSLIACDAAQTLMVRRVEYSNSILVARRRHYPKKTTVVTSSDEPKAESTPLKSNASIIVASLSRIFETHPIRPHHCTHTLLANSSLTLEEMEIGTCESIDREILNDERTPSGRSPCTYLTFIDLVRANDCSPKELAAVLGAMGAVVHRGYVRLLDRKILDEALEAILTYVDAEDEALTWDQLADYFASVYPRIVLQVVRAVYGASTATVESDGISDVAEGGLPLHEKWSSFSLPKVLLGLAGGVFETDPSASPEEVEPGVLAIRMTFDSFWDAWKRRIPVAWPGYGGLPSWGEDPQKALALLRGHVVCYQSSPTSYRDAKVWWLPEYLLPQSIKARVDLLFRLSPQKWDAESMRAFIEPLLGEGQSFTNIIVRYAREYRIPGEPLMYFHLTT
ncbi:unnamed protein product [Phytomonas sp. EM1]|nr:unnamed protein product [Phytomonas sp. EM1]|eukprot:CCW61936.1 unnamed protein product [Phytomonas sp. isolate EM1]